jgi:ceramide glucosyltransferase
MAALGALYYVLSTLALYRHFARPATANRQPPTKLSVLKPVRGLDPELRYNLLTYLSQDYPDYEVLFGVLDADDTAAPLLADLAGRFDHAAFHTGSAIAGANNKVRILHGLAAHATGEVLVVTDADTRATPDFLARIAAEFADPSVGAATCFYRGVKARTTADALEALHMTCLFAPGVAAAEALGGIDFGLGAAMAIRASVLEEVGGFAAIADYLADDFQLGRRTARAGHRVALSDYVVEIALSGEDLAGVLARELRWCRTTRVSNPRGHFGLVTTFGFAYAACFCAATGFAPLGWLVLAAVVAVRGATAWFSAQVCLGDREFLGRAHLLPLADLLSLGVWVAGYLSPCVTWRGRKLRISADGKMKPVS